MSRSGLARPHLRPLVPLYRLALSLRELRLRLGWEAVEQLACPVISIGNLSVGGAGKTPLTIALAHALARQGVAVDVLSRGYARKSREAARVDPEGSYEVFGDEPLLMARSTGVPVYVAPRRVVAGRMAEAAAAADLVHLLDDGFQHRQLHRDVDIVLVNGHDLEDALLPAGNLREPLRALHRATILAIPAEEPETEAKLRGMGFQQPVWRIRRRMDVPQTTRPVVAFCGIARPEQFFRGLEACGLDVKIRKAYPDHFSYAFSEVMLLANLAQASGATLVTTEKDWMRLRSLEPLLPSGVEWKTAALVSEIEDEPRAVGELLQRVHLR